MPGNNLDRDQNILNRLAKIEHKVDSLEQTTAFALRADSEAHFKEVKKIFKRGMRKAQVYLAANGSRNVGDIASHLGMKGPNVSASLKSLSEDGLVEIVDTMNGNIWAKKPVDRTLRISKFLMSEYNLTKDGLAASKDKKKASKNKRR